MTYISSHHKDRDTCGYNYSTRLLSWTTHSFTMAPAVTSTTEGTVQLLLHNHTQQLILIAPFPSPKCSVLVIQGRHHNNDDKQVKIGISSCSWSGEGSSAVAKQPHVTPADMHCLHNTTQRPCISRTRTSVTCSTLPPRPWVCTKKMTISGGR